MRTLLVIWHSRTGTAEALARAVADGALGSDAAASGDIAVRMLSAPETTADDLLGADGYIFAGPENLGSMTGAMKELVDRSYYPLLGQVEGRPWALIVAAGTDGAGTVRQWQRIATGWRLRPIADPLIVCTGADTPETILATKQVPDAALADAAALGAAMAEGLALGIY
ncbi:MAG: NAD(P)H-dependent oxidoreductase [Sphingopyxis sp.]|jgi:multimeric flavodoxin WrbA|nr:NAD(P)H-dependent oxidoreductase [Sphingopyxis sp.]